MPEDQTEQSEDQSNLQEQTQPEEQVKKSNPQKDRDKEDDDFGKVITSPYKKQQAHPRRLNTKLADGSPCPVFSPCGGGGVA
jgi:hypothetical protein